MLKRLLVIIFVLNCCSLFGQWKTLGNNDYAGDQADMVFHVHALNEDVVWGLLFKPATFSPTQTYFKSIDGGVTVTTHEFELEDASLTAFGMHALDENTAWIALTSEPCQCYGQVYKTEDGGATWQKKFDENTEQAIIGVYFWDANEGFAIASDGTGANADRSVFYRTFDGGDTWEETTSSLIEPGEGQWLASGNHGFDVTGDYVSYGTRHGRVFRSSDRGLTWEASSALGNNKGISGVAFQDELNGIAISSLNKQGIPVPNKGWSTSNGGTTWEAIEVPQSVVANSIQHIPETNGTYVITGGWSNSTDMLFTNSLGSKWKLIESPKFIGFSFLSPTIAFGGTIINSATNEGGLFKMVSSFADDHANVTTIAGNRLEGFKTNTFSPLKSNFYNPKGMAMDDEGNLYIANDSGNNILKLSADESELTNVAGTPGFPNDVNVDPLSDASFNRPSDIAIDSQGDLYIADLGNNKIKKISLDAGVATVTTFAGTGENVSEDGDLETASFSAPVGLCIDSNGDLLVAEQYAIRKISSNGMVTTIAGTGSSGSLDGVGDAASFNFIFGMDIDDADNLYVTDIVNSKVRKITPDGVVSTVAGGGFGYVDGPGNVAQFFGPEGIALDEHNNMFVGDGINGFIRKIDTLGNVTSIVGSQHNAYGAGPGAPGPQIMDGDGENAVLSRSRGVFVKPNGDLLHTEWGSDVIRKIQFGVPSMPISVTKILEEAKNLSHIDHLSDYTFGGEVRNTSSDLVDNVVLQAVVKFGTDVMFDQSISTEQIDVGGTEFLVIDESFTPESAGTYDVEFNYFVDGEKLLSIDDVITVSDSIMGYDDGFPYIVNDYSFVTGWENGFGMAHELLVPDTITGMELFVDISQSTTVEFLVFETTNSDLGEVLYQSGPVVFDEDFYGNYIHQIPPLPVDQGHYLFAIKGQADFLDDFVAIGFDNDHLSDQLWMFYEGAWGTVESLLSGYVELAGMIRPILGTVPAIVNVEEVNEFSFEVFPNPFMESISITQNLPQQVKISMMDITGKVVLEKISNDTKVQLNNLSLLPAGAYIIQVEGADFMEQIPVVKN